MCASWITPTHKNIAAYYTALWTQFFPPRGPLTEANLPSQNGKVFIVTGGSSGLGFELSRILYGAGGIVYMLTRSKEHADEAISRIKAHYSSLDTAATNPGSSAPSTRGGIEFIHMDLLDFATVRKATQEFLDRESPNGRLDVLFNIAGTGGRKNAPLSEQGHEYHFCINSMVWAASIRVEMNSPKGGIRREFLEDCNNVKDETELYATSKTSNWFLASEFSRRGQSGVMHIAGNPGQYHTPKMMVRFLWPILRQLVLAGGYAINDGRWHLGQREDLLLALRPLDEGCTGLASDY
ncbi:hypothetical protein F5Y16DRAFT_412665 [Xylariaceae sp. FL0255]|nr:hypothetical protein F5Y16DRAFT_412665 [Xylariaceae sp. FL0255]